MKKLNTNFFIDLEKVDPNFDFCSDKISGIAQIAVEKKVDETRNCPKQEQWEDYWSEIKSNKNKTPTFFNKKDDNLDKKEVFRYQGKFIESSNESLAADCAHEIIKNVLDYINIDFSSVVELGCGNGHNLDYIKSLNKFDSINGCDFSPSAVSIIKEKGFGGFQFDMKRPSLSYLNENKLNNKDTIFFTSGSMEQLGAQWDSLFTFFSNSNVNYIFHIEPILELYSDSELESLASSFHQKKNYLTGYFSFLRAQSKFDVSYSKTDFGTLYDQGFNVVILKR